jgi:hypothetical protein
LCNTECDVKMMTDRLKSIMSEAVVFFFLNQIVHVFTVSDCRQSEREMKSRLAMVEAAFNKKNTLFTRKLDLTLKEERSEMLCLEHRFVWC